MSEKQELIDICFQIGLTIHTEKYFDGMSIQKVAEWISNQLKQCGFPTQPVGASHGILIDE